MFGWFKKGQSAGGATGKPPPQKFWDEMGMGRLVPAYVQLHLAARSRGHLLAHNPDGSINVDDVRAYMHAPDPNAAPSSCG